MFFFFNDTATTEIYTLSLHDALPICQEAGRMVAATEEVPRRRRNPRVVVQRPEEHRRIGGGEQSAARGGLRREQSEDGEEQGRSEEHTSELQSRQYLVCRLLLEKKNK